MRPWGQTPVLPKKEKEKGLGCCSSGNVVVTCKEKITNSKPLCRCIWHRISTSRQDK
jgi:hypothetical protein